MSETCIITGAAGFIGSHLAAALAGDGHRVVGIDNFDSDDDGRRTRTNGSGVAGVELVEMDIRDAALGAFVERVRPDVVYHLAALAGVRRSIEEPARYVSVNVEGTRNVLDAVRQAGAPRVVFASSSSVYGERTSGAFSESDASGIPISPYAATKQAGEQLGHAWSRCFGLSVAMVRLFTAYGPRQRPDLAISRFIERVARGTPVPMYGDGTTCRDYTFVGDVVRGLRAAGAWTATGTAARAFNIGSGRPVTLRALIDEIGLVVGRPAEIDPHPPQTGDVSRTCADLARSRAELGYEPRVDLVSGLREQWAWMRAAGGVVPDAV